MFSCCFCLSSNVFLLLSLLILLYCITSPFFSPSKYIILTMTLLLLTDITSIMLSLPQFPTYRFIFISHLAGSFFTPSSSTTLPQDISYPVSPQFLFMYTPNPCNISMYTFLAFLTPRSLLSFSLACTLLSYFPTLFHFTPFSNHVPPPPTTFKLPLHSCHVDNWLFYFFPLLVLTFYLIFTSSSLNCYTMQYLTSNTSHPQSQLLYISPYPFSLHSSPSNMHLITISIPTVPHLQHLSSPVSTTLYLTSPLQSPLLTLKHACTSVHHHLP